MYYLLGKGFFRYIHKWFHFTN